MSSSLAPKRTQVKPAEALFADIHGFVDVLGDRDPEEVGPIVDRVREI